jgi:hypothetical protein
MARRATRPGTTGHGRQYRPRKVRGEPAYQRGSRSKKLSAIVPQLIHRELFQRSAMSGTGVVDQQVDTPRSVRTEAMHESTDSSLVTSRILSSTPEVASHSLRSRRRSPPPIRAGCERRSRWSRFRFLHAARPIGCQCRTPGLSPGSAPGQQRAARVEGSPWRPSNLPAIALGIGDERGAPAPGPVSGVGH